MVSTDVLIVGGGPVGLCLAIGLRKRGVNVLVLEKCVSVGKDWSSAYTYRLDTRGIECFESLGLLPQLKSVGNRKDSFDHTIWKKDGTYKDKTGTANVAEGYWIARPVLIDLIRKEIPSGLMIEGELHFLSYANGAATAKVTTSKGTMSISAGFVLGCDGSRSAVRENLVDRGGAFAADFEQQILDTPSSGLIYKAMLVKPPKEWEPSNLYVVEGKSGQSLTFLPWAGGGPGEPRPLAKAAPKGKGFDSFCNPDTLYEEIAEAFPQWNVQEALDREAVQVLCASEGSTFPRARWCRKASAWIEGVGVALLGDALHSFPPDLGQGVNAGLVDVQVLLEYWPTGAISGNHEALKRALEEYDRKQAPEAEAICRLIPIGMPYQYKQADLFGKASFFSGLILRLLVWKVLPCLFYPPVIFMVTSKPALPYTEILEKHRANTCKLIFMLCLAILGSMLIIFLR